MNRCTVQSLFLTFLLVGGASCNGDDESYEWGEAFDAEEVGWLLNVWGPSADDLYAVGGTPEEGTIVHFDGTEWAPLSNLPAGVPLLNWAHGFGPSDITVVGNDGAVIHFNGSVWETQDTPTDQDLWGVWGASPSDLWAVGGQGRMEGQATILRYDGTEWTSVDVPELMRPRVYAFFKVWGTSADNIYIVGQRGAVLRFNGSELVEELVGVSDDLISLWGTGPDRIVLVGGRGNGVVVTYDGTEWRNQSLSPLPGLNGVWMRSPDVIHVAGIEGTLAVLDFETLTYEEQYQNTRDAFHAVFGDDSGRLTVVGGNLSAATPPLTGIAYTRKLRSAE